MGGDTHRPSRGNLSFSRPRGRGGRGKKESVNNTKTENKVQRSVQNSSTVDVQQDFEISSSNKVNSFQRSTRFNAKEVEKKLQQRYDEALYSALQSTAGNRDTMIAGNRLNPVFFRDKTLQD
ncbi:uncharacterized protein Gasu_45730 [Galdieria sulphuraria]|uniref:Uncharacterized protein n=1 Tax=Galdieria sulphuraria TaxID=130081 RepID=M2VXD6_GALSU|nr:uncharacterized protein Gasu_45730 [Galdieria sulphuraria]EME27911.1 hypothetical protein Gasu_45730 [Galdieria sulphuraria]|eukprot:XP_005704431.1 hypothetical protein Gasu_45730 [Galdieria sulphuraria]